MLLFSAFFSGMEIAFLGRNRLREEIDRKQNPLFNHIAEVFSRNSSNYITTILVGNNIALVVYSMFMSKLLLSAFGIDNTLAQTIISTVVIIFIGEYIPKSIVRHNPNFYYSALSPVIFLFYIILYPISRLTTLLSYGLIRLTGNRVEARNEPMEFNRDDLASLVEADNVAVDSEDEEDIRLFQNALDFADLRVRDCMVQRVDVEAVDLESTTIEELTQRFVETNYSRIFVWHDTIDNIIGYVNSKSLFERPQAISDVIIKTIYVAETMPLQAMLETFTKRKASIAVVIDEFGGTAGIISLEDVLEQIFGEIEDEHDVQELVEKRLEEHTWMFSARLEVEYLNEEYALGIPESDEYDTLAGYIIAECGGIPHEGETFDNDLFALKILRREGSRLDLVEIRQKQR
ncbi:MAG: HlyC/CorC family transporter [Alistipes sp.]|nr:HlyC/CorC family transporter [Alistipes sp.]MBR5584687.1 HlyC/CorC family transporter [Alistipes sp.]MBR6543956.1 HlyC/CorC family transporter [Alistipes sp.]